MPSCDELIALFKNGELGRLLAREFNGERGRVFPDEDLELIITFKDEESTPTAKSIEELVTSHYRRLGYVVKRQEWGEKCFGAIISEPVSRVVVGVTISTSYPFDGRHASLRLTSVFPW